MIARSGLSLWLALSFLALQGPAAHAGSPEEFQAKINEAVQNLCATPSVTASPSPAPVPATEAAYCEACKGEGAKKTSGPAELSEQLKADAEKARRRRDYDFLTDYLKRGAGYGPVTLDQLKDKLKQYNQALEQKSKSIAELEAQMSDAKKQWKSLSDLYAGNSVPSDQRETLIPLIEKAMTKVNLSMEDYQNEIAYFTKMAEKPTVSASYKQQCLKQIESMKLGLASLEAKKEMGEKLLTWARPGMMKKLIGAGEAKPPASMDEIKTFFSDADPVKKLEYALNDYKYEQNQYQQQVKSLEEQIRKKEEEEKGAAKSPDAVGEVTPEALAALEKSVGNSGQAASNPCGLSKAESIALRQYTGNYYGVLNASLRSNDPAEREKYKNFTEVLRSALQHFRPYKGEVQRGADLPSSALNEHQPGKVVEYRAFTSTSLGDGFDRSIRFVIRSKTGRYIDPYSSAAGEWEVLFPPAKFKVLSREDTFGRSKIVMEEVEE